MVDLRQTLEYAKYMESIGWIVERIDNTNYFIKKIPLIGSLLKFQRPEKLVKKEIHTAKKLSEKHRSFQIIIEPKNSLQEKIILKDGFKKSKSYFVPSKTILIDLTKSEKTLLSEMHHKTRYNIGKAKRNKLQLTESKNINKFAEFWQKCAKTQRGMFLSQIDEINEIYKAFGKNARLILLKKGKETLSGVLLIKAEEVAYYMYAAASIKGKKLFAPTLNAWEAMRLSKKLKCKLFDFEGIYDERFPIKTWRGFSRFKKTFGGKEIFYPGAFSKIKFPL